MTKLQKGYIDAANFVNKYNKYSCVAIDVCGGNKALYIDVMFTEPESRFILKNAVVRPLYVDQEARLSQIDPKELRIWLLCMMVACCEDFYNED